MRWTLATLLVVLAACEPRPPAGRSGLEVRIRSDDRVPSGVAHVTLEPAADQAVAWAVDARSGLPVERTFWPRERGRVLVVAVVHGCEGGCDDVDPFADPPAASGQAVVTLRPGKVTPVTVDVTASTCGDGVVDEQEACDGGAGCDDRCLMEPVALDDVVGDPTAPLEALVLDGEPALAWLDGSCGADGDECLTWATMGGGSPAVIRGSTEVGPSTGLLDADAAGRVAWIETPEGAAARLISAPPSRASSPASLGPTGPSLVPSPLVISPGSDEDPFGLAVDVEERALELRWGTAGRSRAVGLEAGELVKAPSMAWTVAGGEVVVAAVWAVAHPAEVTARWYMKRWSCSLAGDECSVAPLDVSALDLSAAGVEAEQCVVAADPGEGAFVLVGVAGTDLRVRTISHAGLPEEAADEEMAGLLEAGSVLVDAARLPDAGGTLALVLTPLAGAMGCRADVALVGAAGGEPSRVVATWGEDGELGCSASMALLGRSVFLAGFLGPAETVGVARIHWVRSTTVPSF